MTRPFAFALAAGLVVHASGAGAQDNRAAAARRVLLDQAAAANTASDHARALDLAQRAAEIERTPSVRVFIAEQQMFVGQVTHALGSADDCVRELEHHADVTNAAVLLHRCRDVRDRARASVGFVRIAVPEAPGSTRLFVAGEELPSAVEGVATPVDPGSLDVEAVARDGRRAAQHVTVARGQTLDVALRFGTSAATSPTSAPVVAAPAPAAPAAATVRIQVAPSPAFAEVSIDGVLVGTGALTRDVAPGPHVIELRAAGYLPSRDTLTVRAGEPLALHPVLVRAEVLPTTPAPASSRPGWVVPVVVSTVAAVVVAGVATGVYFATAPPEYHSMADAALVGRGTQ